MDQIVEKAEKELYTVHFVPGFMSAGSHAPLSRTTKVYSLLVSLSSIFSGGTIKKEEKSQMVFRDEVRN